MADLPLAVTSASFSKNTELRGEVLKLTRQARFNDTGATLQGHDLRSFLQGCRAAIVGLERIDQELLAACPDLKYVAKYGVGIDNLDLKACERQGVKVSWTEGVNAYAVAEHTTALTLALLRKVYQNATLLRDGVWRKNGGIELRNRVVGVIGAGHVGRETVRLLTAFGARIMINDTKDMTAFAREYGAQVADKAAIFKACEVLTLHVPLTAETRHMINADVLRSMKPAALVINTSRGDVIDQNALKIALRDKAIGGAALDVFHEEPCTDSELLNMENVICTPHTAGNSKEAVLAMGQAAVNNLKGLLRI